MKTGKPAALVVVIGGKMATNSKSGVTFQAPEGFTLPDGVKPGDQFQDMAVLQANDDGTITLLEVDGLPVTDSEEANEPEDEDENDEGGDETETPPAAPPATAPKKKRGRKALADRMAERFASLTPGT